MNKGQECISSLNQLIKDGTDPKDIVELVPNKRIDKYIAMIMGNIFV